jgi:hypothetical protein
MEGTMGLPWIREFRLSCVGDHAGVSCDEHGAFVGPIPLLQCRQYSGGRNIWKSRPGPELTAALSRHYGVPVDLESKAPGLATVARALSRGDIVLAKIATLHLELPDRPKNIELHRLAKQLWASGMLKADWDLDKHPRTGEKPNPGWFAPIAHSDPGPQPHDPFGGNGPQPVVDFSGGFHDAVVNSWMTYFQSVGIPVVQAPAIRVIGPDNSVIGYPDMIVDLPTIGLSVIEVKTGGIPTFTPMQMQYIPALQIGGHIYSLDPRIGQLGLEPGVPFPPFPVFVIHAPGPKLDYEVHELPPPKTEPK